MAPTNDVEPGDPMGFEPSYSSLISIRHYYGDPARAFMLGGAALMLIGSPLYTASLSDQLPLIVLGAIVTVAFAALTNPKGRWTLIGDAAISGAGAALYSGWALLEYEHINPLSFTLRMAIGIIFLFAFYFALKSVRASVLHQIGKREPFNEFEDEDEAGIDTDDEYEGQLRARKDGRLEGWIQRDD